LFDPSAKDAALQGEGELGETGTVEDAATGFGASEAGQGRQSEGTKPGLIVSNDIGEAGEGGISFGVELLSDLREEVVAEPVAAVMDLLVGGVFAPGNLAGLEPVAEAGTG
jgi:hypothetical protein